MFHLERAFDKLLNLLSTFVLVTNVLQDNFN
jgi:hypothetical protein